MLYTQNSSDCTCDIHKTVVIVPVIYTSSVRKFYRRERTDDRRGSRNYSKKGGGRVEKEHLKKKFIDTRINACTQKI